MLYNRAQYNCDSIFISRKLTVLFYFIRRPDFFVPLRHQIEDFNVISFHTHHVIRIIICFVSYTLPQCAGQTARNSSLVCLRFSCPSISYGWLAMSFKSWILIISYCLEELMNRKLNVELPQCSMVIPPF